jgi:hypothetical protein
MTKQTATEIKDYSVIGKDCATLKTISAKPATVGSPKPINAAKERKNHSRMNVDFKTRPQLINMAVSDDRVKRLDRLIKYEIFKPVIQSETEKRKMLICQ